MLDYIYDTDDLAARAEEGQIDLNQQIEIAKIERLGKIALELQRLADMQRRGT